MAQIVWTEPALNDLEDIAEYIALSNLQAAQQLVRNIFEKVDRLKDHPRSGKKPEEIKSLNYREVVVTPCRIFYKIISHDVYILHVMRQEQQLKMYALQHS
ncbi:MAG: type II toxin-antitoxin system RelE/ParE family toxin [Pseudomonadales bacterium]